MNLSQINQNIYLSDTVKVSQYNIDDKLVTVIGEFHKLNRTESPKPNMTISDLINTFFTNPLLLLEVHKHSDISKIHSLNIKDIVENSLYQWRGIDNRDEYIKHSSILYYTENHLKFKLRDFMSLFYSTMNNGIKGCHKSMDRYKLKQKQEVYLNVFLEKLSNDIKFIKHTFEPTVAKFILNDNDVTIEKYLSDKINYIDTKTGVSFLKVLRNFWMKISDFEVILNIFTAYDYNNIIILIGAYHSEHLDTILKKFKIYPIQNELDPESRYKLNYTNLSDFYYQ